MFSLRATPTSVRARDAALRCLHGSAVSLGKFGSNRKHKGSLTSKEMPPGWYKGSGGRTLGRHTRKGGFKLDEDRVPHYVVPPGLDVFPLKAYVSKKTPLIRVAPPNYDELLEKMIAQHAEAYRQQQAATATAAAAAAATPSPIDGATQN